MNMLHISPELHKGTLETQVWTDNRTKQHIPIFWKGISIFFLCLHRHPGLRVPCIITWLIFASYLCTYWELLHLSWIAFEQKLHEIALPDICFLSKINSWINLLAHHLWSTSNYHLHGITTTVYENCWCNHGGQWSVGHLVR